MVRQAASMGQKMAAELAGAAGQSPQEGARSTLQWEFFKAPRRPELMAQGPGEDCTRQWFSLNRGSWVLCKVESVQAEHKDGRSQG